jgi:hypothetical protein
MATTTNYGFEIPDDTDLVKDGALAMRDLGQDVDTQLFTALGGDYPGLRLIKKQTIGTGVASVTITDAFSSTYKNYKILLSDGVASANSALTLQLGATNTQYYSGTSIVTYANAHVTASDSAATKWSRAGHIGTDGGLVDITLYNPFETYRTGIDNVYTQLATNGSGGYSKGYQNSATSFTAFTIAPTSGTLTGGTIYVYGYGAS